jgi:iron complex outermembrane receptor protein
MGGNLTKKHIRLNRAFSKDQFCFATNIADIVPMPMQRPILCLLLLSFSWTTARAADFDLTQMSLEELVQIEVTTASRKAEKWVETAAAVYVITGEEIRRSGVTSLPDLLRGVPGVQVAQADASKWAITARGFNGP